MSGWHTIESDAGVFTSLIEDLGVEDVQFEELTSLDPESLRQHGTVYGVIFLFKVNVTEPHRDTPQDGVFDHGASDRMFFASQTIQNACGTQALLGVLLNQDQHINVGSGLKDFKDFTSAFPPEFRGETLSNSELIRDTHNSFARSSPFISEMQRAATEEDDLYHFIAYTPVHDTLYEIDGLQAAPISHGPCTPSEFPDKIVPVIQRRMGRYPPSEIKFNLLTLVKDPRIRAREIGDEETLEREDEKRKRWLWENTLRRHNFLGFVGEVLQLVAREKRTGPGHEGFKHWIEDAKSKTAERVKKGRGEVDEVN